MSYSKDLNDYQSDIDLKSSSVNLKISLGYLSNPKYEGIQRGDILGGVGIEKVLEEKNKNLTITTYKITDQLSDTDMSSDIGKYVVEASYMHHIENGVDVELVCFRANDPLKKDELNDVKNIIKSTSDTIKINVSK